MKFGPKKGTIRKKAICRVCDTTLHYGWFFVPGGKSHGWYHSQTGGVNCPERGSWDERRI